MSIIEAVYENGVFRPLGPVDLPEHARVRVEPEESSREREGWDSVYETLSRRYQSGESDVSEHHNEHQP